MLLWVSLLLSSEIIFYNDNYIYVTYEDKIENEDNEKEGLFILLI